MVFFDRFLSSFFMMYEVFFSRTYITEDNRFIRHRKMTYEEYIKYIIARWFNTNYSEVIRYYRGFLKKDFESITEQAVNKQRKYIIRICLRI